MTIYISSLHCFTLIHTNTRVEILIMFGSSLFACLP